MPTIITRGAASAKAFGFSVAGSSFNGFNTPALVNGYTGSGAYIQSVTVNSAGLFVLVGFTSNSYPLYATSTDGNTWSTPAKMNGSTAPAIMYAVTVNSSGLFVATGSTDVGPPLYATSTDGSTWTTPALMNGSSTIAFMQAVTVSSSGKYVAVGVDSNPYPVYATSK